MVDDQRRAVMGQNIQGKLIHTDGFIDPMGDIRGIPGRGMNKTMIGAFLF